ncbi:conserved hypothetical protein [Gloeothece citriformis PCC 7424]|uniref:DUF1997 domain-containing protein n=1 Tax=Gloeothece citriformis (strain PCC 7424) TaxID=65393 RepID=B7KAY4_GLOC7|nr:DUF1997 domain-containing protein [Gloeothece citriformis]ACK70094.1 conserved hypothetical protein [Gloeothece citriformis PCC 7424]
MQCQYFNEEPLDLSNSSLQPADQVNTEQLELADVQPLHFQTDFAGCMEMYSDVETVAQYLASHEGWFCRCAEPMRTESFGENGYILVIGRYGAFGFDVEPKMAVILDPAVEQTYNMYSVPIPNEPYIGYEVDYNASMKLKEIPLHEAAKGIEKIYKKQGLSELPEVITRVSWELHLKVSVRFPKFIYKLPLSVIQKTGDRVLTEIIRQVSPRLTLKVQKDFHERHELPLPSKEGRQFYKISVEDEQVA